ncbi:zinc-binding dehydrogenase [Zavarzinella formosa]|uniref:zinc-binding dehydrogenase n=1 Tax=Zavarzinella formosa TaxID=360055 RepID=UPI0002F3F410|nr:zinc-binding dehydrogenase [Zavarzinella formosa]
MIPEATVALFHAVGQPFDICVIPKPVAGPGEMIVDVTGCTICGSDLHTCAGHRQVAVPTVLGHEVIGRVCEFGPEAPRTDFTGKPLSIGDRVTWSVAVNCGHCFFCNRGLPQKCERLLKYGHAKFDGRPDGGLTSVVVLRAGSAVFRIPDSLPDEVASPANCATATVVAALRVAETLAGQTALVQGAGMLGLTACAMLHTAGARVLCADPTPSRRELAKQFGAESAVSPEEVSEAAKVLTSGYGFDMAFEFSGAAAAMPAGLAAIRIGGTYVLAGAVFPGPSLPIDPEQFIRRHLRLFGIHNYTPTDLGDALSFLDSHPEYPFASLVSKWFPLSDVDAAFAHARSPGVLRVGVRPSC